MLCIPTLARMAVFSGLAAAVGAVSAPASAGHKRHRHHATQAQATKAPVVPNERSFYPNEIEGGVSGNLPFNNHIRKFKDPLNANGGR